MKTIRIGSGAGTANDPLEPAIELLEKGRLDYLIFECLAERTIAQAMLRKEKDPTKGYDMLLEYRFEKILAVYQKQSIKTKIISNMGAANPLGAAQKIAKMAQERGLGHLKIAAVIGDDVLDQVQKYMNQTTIETGEKLELYKNKIINANAYIGCAGIVEALKNGADIVITGRAADPSLTVGPCVYEFGWSMDDWDTLGKATIAGHILECCAQVTGGYFADPGVKPDVPELWHLGYPIAVIRENGDMEITKIEESGGSVNEMTVKEQLLYEIQDPANYLTPDVVADFTNIEIRQTGENRVFITGGAGKSKSRKLKLNCGYHDSFIGEGEISYGGFNCLKRAQLAGEMVLKRLELCGVPYEEIRVDLIGINSLFKDAVGWSMTSGNNSEVRLRVAARTKDQMSAERIALEVEGLYCCGPAAGGGVKRSVREIIALMSVLIDEKDVTTKILYFGGNRS